MRQQETLSPEDVPDVAPGGRADSGVGSNGIVLRLCRP